MDILFARYGGLSPVNYKKQTISSPFHIPPRKKGIYAFLYPYIEPFFWAWNETKYKNVKSGKDCIRKFHYDGILWCHFCSLFPDNMIVGSWVQLSFEEYKKAVKEIRKIDQKMISCNYNRKIVESGKYIVVKNPYNNRGGCSTDHLEVFIESKYLGKIR